MMAQTKKTVRKSSLNNLHIARLATLPRAEQTFPNEEDTDGDIKVQEVEDQGEVHPATPSNAEGDEEEGDYVVKEYTEAHPLRRKSPPEDRWISPPSVATTKKMTNLFDRGLLGIVECFLPSPGKLATDPGEGYCAWSGAHTKQGAMLPLLPYFKKIANYYHISLNQFTPKDLKYFFALFVLYSSRGW
uniref:Uncharacterized protein n=1 Tax=Cannabis sativa TaxID=3483 RepID=A0A803QBZ7_CANSA